MADKDKRRRRRQRKQRKSKGFKTVNVVKRSLNPIPQRYICKMKFAKILSSNPGGGSYAAITLNLNSISDPTRGGISQGQAYSHDTFATLYSRYRVIGCAYRITATTADGNYLQTAVIPNNGTMLAGPPSGIGAPGSVSIIREKPRAKYILQAPNAPLKVVSGYVSMPSLTGRTKAQYMADDRYQSDFNNSPLEAMVLNVYSSLLTELNFSTTVYYNVMLEYTVELFDPKLLPDS